MPSYSGLISASTVQSLLQLRKPHDCAFMVVERQRIDKARNLCAAEAIRVGADYLFFVDDDNPIPSDALVTLLSDDKDVVGAPILGRVANQAGHYPLCAFYSSTISVDERDVRLYHNIEAFRDPGPLHRVDAIGTGCLLIKRQVLVTLQEKHTAIFEFGDLRFSPTYVNGKSYDRRTMSEDCEFCERAVDAGFEVWLDERVRPFHMIGINWVQWGNSWLTGT